MTLIHACPLCWLELKRLHSDGRALDSSSQCKLVYSVSNTSESRFERPALTNDDASARVQVASGARTKTDATAWPGKRSNRTLKTWQDLSKSASGGVDCGYVI